MGRRTHSRHCSLQFLFYWYSQSNLSPDRESIIQQFHSFYQDLQYSNIDEEMVINIITGVIEHEDNLKNSYQRFINKTPSLMNHIILLIGSYELLFTTLPFKVIINEAINLAHKYSTKEAAPFINNILDQVAKERS